MYIFEAHYTNMDNDEEITRKIEFDGQFMTSCKSAKNSLQSRKARSRCISSRFRERERPADGGRQRKALQGCRNSPEGVTSSAGKRKPFLFMPI